MDLRQIQYFLAVVEHESFTKAAAALHVAQPSLSQAIRTLERQVGTELLIRRAAGVRLTAAGMALLGPARQIVRDFDAAQEAINEVLGLAGGTLDVVAQALLVPSPVSQLLGQLRREHPRVSCTLVSARSSHDLAELARRGSFEVGFLYALPGSLGGLDRQGFVYEPLAEHEYWCILPPGTVVPDGPLTLDDLSDQEWVAPPPGGPMTDLIVERFAQVGVRGTRMVITDARTALVPLVVAGAGGTILPEASAREAAEHGAVIRPLSPPLRQPYGAVHRATGLSPAANRLLEIARTRLLPS